MAGVTYGNRGGKVRVTNSQSRSGPAKSAEDVVREIKATQQSTEGDYREQSLVLHGLICGRCGREFDTGQRHLLTIHHKDGNHHNNPPDGSNWENLCVYCHEDVHSRGLLGDYMEGTTASREAPIVYQDKANVGATGLGTFGERLQKALDKKKPPR